MDTGPCMLVGPTRDNWVPYAGGVNTGPVGPICWWGQHGATGPHILVGPTLGPACWWGQHGATGPHILVGATLGHACWWGQHGASESYMLVLKTRLQSFSVLLLGFPHLRSVQRYWEILSSTIMFLTVAFIYYCSIIIYAFAV